MCSVRLDSIVDMTPVVNTAADIGSDHGKTALKLLESGKAKHIICSDISSKSLEKAEALAQFHGIKDRVSFRVGDGVNVLCKGEADAVVISGMGGELIVRILDEGRSIVPDLLILSSNSKTETLRGWLCENGFRIKDEDIVLENRRFYPVIFAVKGVPYSLSKLEMEIGPVLIHKKTEIFKKYLEKCIQNTELKHERIFNSGSKESKKD